MKRFELPEQIEARRKVELEIPTEHLRHPASYLPRSITEYELMKSKGMLPPGVVCFDFPAPQVQTSFPAPDSFGEGVFGVHEIERESHRSICSTCYEDFMSFILRSTGEVLFEGHNYFNSGHRVTCNECRQKYEDYENPWNFTRKVGSKRHEMNYIDFTMKPVWQCPNCKAEIIIGVYPICRYTWEEISHASEVQEGVIDCGRCGNKYQYTHFEGAW
jgi:hypothetical protein